MLRSSPRPRQVRRRWVSPSQSLRKKIRPSSTYTDEETGQTIIAGMGELHLEIIVDRLLREFKVEANVGQTAGRPTKRRSARPSIRIPSMPVSPAVRVSTVTVRSSLSPTSPVRVTSSSTRSSAVLFRRNTFPPSMQVFRALCRTVSSQATT